MRDVLGSIDNLTEKEINRIREIRSGLISACFGLHDDETFLFAFLDYLHLLFQPTPEQDPLAFTVWLDTECVYSSFRDLYYTNKYPLDQKSLKPPASAIRISQENDLWLAIHRVKTSRLYDLESRSTTHTEPSSSFQEQILSTCDVDQLLRNASVLLNSEDPRLGTCLVDIPDFEHLLVSSIMKDDRPEYPSRELGTTLDDIDYRADILPMLDSFRGVLDEVLLELPRSPLFPDHSPDLGNIFCVVRTVQSAVLRLNSYPYTAGLLLSNKQRTDFNSWCTSGCKKKDGDCPLGLAQDAHCLDYFETPLGRDSRSAADVTFCSGIIDFGRKPDDRVWDCVDKTHAQENQRVLVERCVYPKAARSQDQGPSLYYVPVHVNGVPWLVLFTFSPAPTSEDRKQTRWYHNYTFYREATRKAVSYIRWRAEEEYLTQLATSAFGERVSWHLAPDEIQRRVNVLWDLASRVFPFPRFRLIEVVSPPAPEEERIASLPGIPGRNEHWGILIEKDNPYFGSCQVTWGRVECGRLCGALLRMMTSQIKGWANISSAESTRTVAYTAHLFKTPLNKLRARLRRLPNDKNKKAFSALLQQLEDFATFAMASIDKRRWHKMRQDMKTVSVPEFYDLFEAQLSATLETLSDVDVFGDSSTKAVASVLSSKQDRISFGFAREMLSGSVRYHEVQLHSVLFEVMANAVKALVDTDHFFQIDCPAPANREVRIVVRNATRRGPHEVHQDAQRANSGSADLLGVTNIIQSCDALGFSKPKWFSETNSSGRGVMGIEVSVGSYQPLKEKES